MLRLFEFIPLLRSCTLRSLEPPKNKFLNSFLRAHIFEIQCFYMFFICRRRTHTSWNERGRSFNIQFKKGHEIDVRKDGLTNTQQLAYTIHYKTVKGVSRENTHHSLVCMYEWKRNMCIFTKKKWLKFQFMCNLVLQVILSGMKISLNAGNCFCSILYLQTWDFFNGSLM